SCTQLFIELQLRLRLLTRKLGVLHRELELELLEVYAVIRLGVDHAAFGLTNDSVPDNQVLFRIDGGLEPFRLETPRCLLIVDLQLDRFTLRAAPQLRERRIDDVELQQLARIDDHSVLFEAQNLRRSGIRAEKSRADDLAHLANETCQRQSMSDLAQPRT